jgi:hypothetical protein
MSDARNINELAHVLICYKMVLFKDCVNLEHWLTLVGDNNDICELVPRKTQVLLDYSCFYNPKDLCSKLLMT